MKRFADCHVHIDDYGETSFARPQQMLDLMADLGVTDAALLAYGPFSHVTQNFDVLYHKHTYKRMALRAFGWIDDGGLYKHIPAEHQFERLYELGIDGVKFINMKPNYRKHIGFGINDPFYDKALSMMEERGTPVLIHSGDPERNWNINEVSPAALANGWYYGDGTYPSCQQLYEECYEMLDKHPRLNVTLAHLFFLSNKLDEARRLLDKYPNVRLDLAPGTEMFVGFSKNIDLWHDFFVEYGDRILFGTDSVDTNAYTEALHNEVLKALTHDKSEFELDIYYKPTVRGLELPSGTVDKICCSNFIDFAGEEIVPVNTELLLEAAARMLSDVKDLHEYSEEAKWLSELPKRL